jgi:pyrimidine deaminase RibD-like protein
MEHAVTLARQCVSEEGKISPKVGAVVARGALMLGEAFRGELAPGDHAESTLLESKLGNETLDRTMRSVVAGNVVSGMLALKSRGLTPI